MERDAPEYVVYNGDCNLKPLGYYPTYEEAVDAAALLESCGVEVSIRREHNTQDKGEL